jgi:glycosyltransferase involved in cell wall biosynthesis
LKEHHVVVFPSIGHEAFATVPLESMAAGVPVISTTVGGNKEYLKNEENALVFESGDHNQLSSCIIRLIENPELYNKLVINGKDYVKMYHTSKKIIDKTELYLKNAFDNHNYNKIKSRRYIA